MQLTMNEGMLKVGDMPELSGYHLEGDTRVMFHAKHADIRNPANIVIRANDTDIAYNVSILENSSIREFTITLENIQI